MTKSTRIYLVRRKRKLPSGIRSAVWQLRWFGSDGKPQSETIGSCNKLARKDAEQLRRDKEVAIGSGKIRRDKPKRSTLEAFAELDRQTIAADVRASTLLEHGHAMQHAKDALGADILIADIGWPHIGAIKAYMSKAPSAPSPGEKLKRLRTKAHRPATIRKTLSTLRAAWNRAVKQGLVNSNPFAELGMPKIESKAKRIFSRADIEAMVKSAPDTWWGTFIRTAATTGLRLNESLNLRWSDIDIDKGLLTVQRKESGSLQIGDKTFQTWEWSAKAKASYRTVPLCDVAVAQLKKQQVRQGASPFVFIDVQRLAMIQRHITNGSLPARYDLVPNVLRDFQIIQKHAAHGKQWPLGCVHDLRRTYCTMMADVVPMHVLKQWAGHSDIATTAGFYLAVGEGMAERARQAFAAAG